MHVCPYCHKLGITTFDAIGNPFSHGLASCRFCHNTSKRRYRYMAAPLMVPIATALWFVVKAALHPPQPFEAFWLFFLLIVAVVLADRLTTFEKVQMTT
jgi:hypothetical protein